jgi:hypothetical protein
MRWVLVQIFHRRIGNKEDIVSVLITRRKSSLSGFPFPFYSPKAILYISMDKCGHYKQAEIQINKSHEAKGYQ